MKSDPCAVCGGTDTHLVDGYYYCVECGTQDTTVMETVVESGVLQDGTYAVAGKRRVKTKKVAFEMSGEWYKWHAYNFILSGIADEVISLGASPSFKSKLLWIWILYIKKFHNKEDYETNNLTRQNEKLESCFKDTEEKEEENDDGDDDVIDQNDGDDNDDDDDINKHGKKNPEITYTKISYITFPTIYAMVYCALNLDKSDIQVSDLIRFIREGRLSYMTALKYVPKELDTSKIVQWRLFLASAIKPFSLQCILLRSCSLFKQLDLGTPFVPNLGSLVTRYCKELCLPKEFRQLVMSLLELMPPETSLKGFWACYRQIPEFETTVMAYIVVGLKMCFGLDDDYDIKLTYAVNEINDEENHVKAYRIGLYEPTDRLFSFGEWLKYLEFRKLLLCKYYQPMSLLYHLEVNDALISESIKDHVKYEKSTVRDAMTFESLKCIPQDTDFNILPKEGFPASLTPLTVYTEHILLNAQAEDSRIKLLLSEDFSKYSLKYACVDLKLQFTAVTENLIKGVEEINKDSARRVENSLKTRKIEVNRREGECMAFVIDAENDDVLGSYAELNSLDGDDIDMEMVKEETKHVAVPIVNEINTIPELDADDNIFGVDFDENEIEIRQTDLYSQEHQVDELRSDDRDEMRDETFLDLINDSEFDPQNFNREDVIKSLILRYCTKYKIPKPFEYKELSSTVRKTDKFKDDNKNYDVIKPRKPREAYTGELNSNNILKLYKTTVDKMTQEIESELNGFKNDFVIRGDIPPIPEQPIETTEEIANTDGIALEPIVLNTDGFGLLPLPTVETPTPMDVTDVLFDVSESDLFPAPLEAEVVNDIELANETELTEETAVPIDQEHEELPHIDVNDIVLAEIKMIEEESKKVMPKSRRCFNKADEIPLAKLFGKTLRNKERSNMMPLINKQGLNRFNYYMLKHNKLLTRTTSNRSYSFEKEMLENFPQSYRYVLQTLSAMIQVNSYELFRILHDLEESLLDMDLMDLDPIHEVIEEDSNISN